MEESIISEYINIPVLFLVFNRIDTAKQVFNVIKKAKPPRLYIGSDGPREQKEGEAEKVKAVREYVLSSIDWDCEVKTLFREKNLGCKYAVSSAITWFFEHEDMGIILEDDCLPSLSFFKFCEELLIRYKDDKSIWHIGGSNFQDGIKRGDADYYFSAINHIWGWASWADRWKFYDKELNNIQDSYFINNYWSGKAFKYWEKIFWKMKNKEIDTWDYQWAFSMWKNNGIAILPNVNMISNIGFGIDSRSKLKKPDKNINRKRYEIDLINIKHPLILERNIRADIYTIKEAFFISNNIISKIKNKIIRFFES